MKLIVDYLRELTAAAVNGWNRFWFTPGDIATLAVLRICAGAMLFYTHLVWTKELDAFFGPAGYIPTEAAQTFYGDSFPYAFSYLWSLTSPTALWSAHLAGLVVSAMFTVGLFTRVTGVLNFLVAVSYANRAVGALFGLDQINVMLATYLMLAPCGDAYSVDRLLAARRAGRLLPAAAPTVSATIATRLIQLHMCIIYFFAGLGKLQGESWWYGDALWGAAANLEYQTVDLTWLAYYPTLTAALTQGTAYWELFFCVLVWPRITRPLTMFVALPLHLSIGICMGLMTFGLIMPVGVMSFVDPRFMRRLVECCGERNASIADEETGAASKPVRAASRRAS